MFWPIVLGIIAVVGLGIMTGLGIWAILSDIFDLHD